MRQALPKHRCLSIDNSSDLRRFVSLRIAESPKSREVHVFLKYCVTLIYQRSKIHTVSWSCSKLDYITINRSQAWDNKQTTNMESTSAPSLGKKLSPPNHRPITLITRSEFSHLPATTWHCILLSRNIRKNNLQRLGRAEYNWTHFSVPSQAPYSSRKQPQKEFTYLLNNSFPYLHFCQFNLIFTPITLFPTLHFPQIQIFGIHVFRRIRKEIPHTLSLGQTQFLRGLAN
jgi:hypothetical protein